MKGTPLLIDDLEHCNQIVRDRLAGSEPTFLARVGGSDTDLLIDLHHLAKSFPREQCLIMLADRIETLKRYNGFYDLSGDNRNIFQFYDVLVSAFQHSSELFLVGATLLSELLPLSIHESFRVNNGSQSSSIRAFIYEKVIADRQVSLLPYSYIERLCLGTTLFSLFSKLLAGKRVLVVSPFKNSIEANFKNRFNFFKDFEYPDFELVTYEAPITYPGLPRSFYPDQNWFETAARIESDISKLNFDIALLSCGSYAMPLGAFIKSNLKRSAVYVGGCLQLFFGVNGRRYENPFFLDQIRPEYFIKPLERERFLRHVDIPANAAAEAFGAYF